MPLASGSEAIMFGIFKRKSKRPPDYELATSIASVIDAFISREGSEEFGSDRLRERAGHCVLRPPSQLGIRSDP